MRSIYITKRTRQEGVTLLESLVAILLFSIGLLALVAMFATSVAAAGDAQYRIEATNQAQALLQQISSAVARDLSGTVDAADLALFAHQTTASSTPPCPFSGVQSGKSIVSEWAAALSATGSGLPGSSAATQQVVVDTGNFNQVSVTICWRTPTDPTTSWHWHEVVAHIN